MTKYGHALQQKKDSQFTVHSSGFRVQPFILRVLRWLSSAPGSPDTERTALFVRAFFSGSRSSAKGHLTITEKTLESAAIRRHLKRDPPGNLQRRWRCGNEKNIWHVWHQAGRNAFACRHCHDRDGFCRYDPMMETEVYINELLTIG